MRQPSSAGGTRRRRSRREVARASHTLAAVARQESTIRCTASPCVRRTAANAAAARCSTVPGAAVTSASWLPHAPAPAAPRWLGAAPASSAQPVAAGLQAEAPVLMGCRHRPAESVPRGTRGSRPRTSRLACRRERISGVRACRQAPRHPSRPSARRSSRAAVRVAVERPARSSPDRPVLALQRWGRSLDSLLRRPESARGSDRCAELPQPLARRENLSSQRDDAQPHARDATRGPPAWRRLVQRPAILAPQLAADLAKGEELGLRRLGLALDLVRGGTHERRRKRSHVGRIHAFRVDRYSRGSAGPFNR